MIKNCNTCGKETRSTIFGNCSGCDQKIKRKKRADAGLCLMCGENFPEKDRKCCLSCLERQRTVSIEKRKRRLNSKHCSDCGLEILGKREYCDNCFSKRQERYIKNKIKMKWDVLLNYGTSCACCGETVFEFLTVDHIGGGGKKHRANKIANMNRWLIANNFPDGFQILCFNCNLCKYLNGGICSHKGSSRPEPISSQAKKRRFVREQVLKFYSGTNPECACCGETNADFLTIDHVDGGGNQHRKTTHYKDIYSWLFWNKFPPGFRILCSNCNSGRSINKNICPHEVASD